jgi:hypothetical protein
MGIIVSAWAAPAMATIKTARKSILTLPRIFFSFDWLMSLQKKILPVPPNWQRRHHSTSPARLVTAREFFPDFAISIPDRGWGQDYLTN